MTHQIQHIAVLGGSGFIGHAIVEALLKRGCRVMTVNRGVTPVRYSSSVAHIAADRRNPERYAAELACMNVDAVVDVTAYHPDETKRVCEAFRDRLERFVHISSSSVYHWPLHCPVPESAPLETDAFNTYGFQKAACENLIFSQPTDRLPWTILRLPPVIGPRDPFSRETYLYGQIMNGKPIVVPPRPYRCQNLFVKDAAKAVCGLLECPQAVGKAYNTGGKPFTLESYVDHLAEMAGKSAQMMRADAKVLAQSGADLQKIPYYFEGDVVLDTRRIRDDIGFEPEWPMEKALAETVKAAAVTWEKADYRVWGLPWDTLQKAMSHMDERTRS